MQTNTHVIDVHEPPKRRRTRTWAVVSAAIVCALVVVYAAVSSSPQVASRIDGVVGPRTTVPQASLDATQGSDVDGAAVDAVVDPISKQPAEIAETTAAATGSVIAPGRATVSIADFGARANDGTDDSRAIQHANDEIARRGGGDVIFPPGDYIAAGIRQDSGVAFVGAPGVVLKHPGSPPGTQIIHSRVRTTSGSIDDGSRALHVHDASGALAGVPIAIRAAGGPSATQVTTLAAPMTAQAAPIRPQRVFGFSTGSTYAPNHLDIEGEIISYARISDGTFAGVQRGLFGTTARAHKKGARVAQSSVLYAHVRSSSKTLITLDRRSPSRVRDATVWIGSIGTAVRGLALDGSRRSSGGPQNRFPVLYELARYASVTGCRISNADAGGIRFDKGTESSRAEDNVLTDTGNPAAGIGAGVWVFRASTRNVVRNNAIRGSSVSGVIIDDRTVASTEWDGDSSKNVVERNEIELPRERSNAAVAVFGSSNNRVTANRLIGSTFGLYVFTGGQSIIRPATAHNLFVGNEIRRNYFGIWVDGSYNSFADNELADAERPVSDSGEGNSFE